MWGRFCIYFGLASSLLATVGLYSDALLVTYVSFILQAAKTTGEPYAYSSINVYLCAVRDWHIKNGLPVPTSRPLVRRAVKAAKKFCKRQGRVERKWPISAQAIRLWKATLDFSEWDARVLYAAALLAFFGLHRVSELAITKGTYKGLRRGNVLFSKEQHNGVPVWVTINLEYTKTDTMWRYGGKAKYFQSGRTLCVVSALWAILKDDTRPAHSPLFVLTVKGRVAYLARRHIAGIVKEMARLSGLPMSKFDTHSFRAGGACALWAAGYTAGDIQVYGRWRSDCWRIYVCQSDDKLREVTRRMAAAPADGIFYAQIHDSLRVEPIEARSFARSS